MATPPPRVARIDRADLDGVPAAWTDAERGRHLRRLLRGRGVDPDGLWRVEYHPHRRCWLVSQPDLPAAAGPRLPDEFFYLQTAAELRRSALAVLAAPGGHSAYVARHGRPYELPAGPQEISPADFIRLLGGPAAGAAVHFDGEGGWQSRPASRI